MAAETGAQPNDRTLRSIDLHQIGEHRWMATNRRGGGVSIGPGKDPDFTPVELLLAAIAGCSGIDVDYITSKRAEPEALDLRISADKVRDDSGNHLTDITLTFDIRFPEGEAGDAARAVVPRAVAQSHDRLCTVSRTVELGTPIATRIVGGDGAAADSAAG